MIAYFDTSAIVALLVEEPGSERANLLWDDAERVVTTPLLYPESRAALAQANRIGRLSRADLHVSGERLEDLYAQMEKVEVSDAVVRRAGALAELLGLRGYDAVHLASAETLADLDVVLVAGDQALCRSATSLGLFVGQL